VRGQNGVACKRQRIRSMFFFVAVDPPHHLCCLDQRLRTPCFRRQPVRLRKAREACHALAHPLGIAFEDSGDCRDIPHVDRQRDHGRRKCDFAKPFLDKERRSPRSQLSERARSL
jgi:hypothetical protein